MSRHETGDVTIRMGKEIDNMFTSLEVLDTKMRGYTLDPRDFPRPDYERQSDLILNYERSRADGWNNDLRFKYDRLLEKRAVYENIWIRWCDEARIEYFKPGNKI